MQKYKTPTRTTYHNSSTPEHSESINTTLKKHTDSAAVNPGSSLIVGAKTLAGIGIGLITVIAGSAVIGVATEAILVPSLLVKLAGGIAGGGVGMAKGLKDVQKNNRGK